MKSDEIYIEEKYGRQNPFVVPEGYFAKLSDNILQNEALQTAGNLENRAKPVFLKNYILYIAVACLVMFVFGLSVLWKTEDTERQVLSTVSVQQADNSNVLVGDEWTEYTMLDNDDIYSLIASN